MFGKTFISIGYPVVGFIFLIFVTIIYFVNKRFNSYANKTFRALLLFTYLASVLLLITMVGASKFSATTIITITAKLYVFAIAMWVATMVLYILICLYLRGSSQKTIRTFKLIIYGICFIYSIVAFFQKVEFQVNGYYTICGDILKYLYIIFAIAGLFYSFSLIFKSKIMNKMQIVMHSMTIIATLVLFLLDYVTSWDINFLTFIIVIVPIALYFSSESSAYLQGKELVLTKSEFENANEVQYQTIMELSNDLINPLSQIIYENKIIDENELTDEQFKNEKIKIYNETKKIYDLIIQTSQNESEVANNE